MAKQDQFGCDIKLQNGNVASRVLPVRIHDLDDEDKKVIENVIGPLRAVDFIFKSSGVNRPLNVADRREDNLNKLFYRDQINKIANAIKEIIVRLKNKQSVTQDSQMLRAETSQGDENSFIKKKRSWVRAIYIPVALLLLLTSGFLLLKVFGKNLFNTSADKSIAVLPFVNMSNDPEQEYFSDGLTEELLNRLAKIPELKVIGRTSSFSFKGKNEDLRVIAEKLGVAYILEGSVRKSGKSLRITTQLIQAADASHLWSETYDRSIEDIFKVQDEISIAVVQQLKSTFFNASAHTDAETILTNTVGVNSKVLEYCFLGRYHAAKFKAEDYRKALEYFLKATAIDSTYAPAYCGISECYYMLSQPLSAMPHLEGMPKARVAALKALELDNKLAEAYTSFAFINFIFDWDFSQAEKNFAYALEFDPQSVTAHRFYAVYLMAMGHFDEALRHTAICDKIDPLNMNIKNVEAEILYNARNYDGSIRIWLNVLELDPADSRASLFLISSYIENGMFKELFSFYEKSNIYPPKELTDLKAAYKKDGVMGYWRWRLSRLRQLSKTRYFSPSSFANIYVRLDERDSAFMWLDRAYEARDGSLAFLKVNPVYDRIRSDPRFTKFLKKMAFPN
jgi:TolB-like protein